MDAEQRARLDSVAGLPLAWGRLAGDVQALLAAYDAVVARVAELEAEETGRVMLAAYDAVVAEEEAGDGR